MTYKHIIPLILLASIAILQFAMPAMQVLFTLALAKGLAVLGVIVLLQAGQVSFGHALFFGVAAYTAAFFGKAFAGGELFTSIILGTLVTIIVSYFVGLFVVRYRHIFFGMLNLAFSMIFFSFLEKFYHYTGGSDGIAFPRPTVLGFEMERAGFENVLFWATLCLSILATFLTFVFLNSPIGNMLKTIKTNEIRLEYLGVSPRNVLLIGYLVSAALCGVGGSISAVAQGVVTPEFAWWIRSAEFVFIAILGGAGSVTGAFVGSIIYELVRTYAVAFTADAWQMILGTVLLIVILYAPTGVMGLYNKYMERFVPKTGSLEGEGK